MASVENYDTIVSVDPQGPPRARTGGDVLVVVDSDWVIVADAVGTHCLGVTLWRRAPSRHAEQRDAELSGPALDSRRHCSVVPRQTGPINLLPSAPILLRCQMPSTGWLCALLACIEADQIDEFNIISTGRGPHEVGIEARS